MKTRTISLGAFLIFWLASISGEFTRADEPVGDSTIPRYSAPEVHSPLRFTFGPTVGVTSDGTFLGGSAALLMRSGLRVPLYFGLSVDHLRWSDASADQQITPIVGRVLYRMEVSELSPTFGASIGPAIVNSSVNAMGFEASDSSVVFAGSLHFGFDYALSEQLFFGFDAGVGLVRTDFIFTPGIFLGLGL